MLFTIGDANMWIDEGPVFFLQSAKKEKTMRLSTHWENFLPQHTAARGCPWLTEFKGLRFRTNQIIPHGLFATCMVQYLSKFTSTIFHFLTISRSSPSRFTSTLLVSMQNTSLQQKVLHFGPTVYVRIHCGMYTWGITSPLKPASHLS